MPKGKGPFPIVILCHGMGGSCKDGKHRVELSNQLNKEKIAAFRFDFNGHGESQGRLEDVTVGKAINDLKSAIKFLKNKKELDIKRLGLVGDSFGGAVVENIASQNKSINALALRAAASNYPEVRLRRLGKKGIQKWKETGIYIRPDGKKSKYSFWLDCQKWIGLKAASKIKASTIIFHGDKDESVPVSQSKKLYKLLKSEKKLVILKGAGHHFKKYKDKVNKQTVNWFKKYL